MCSSASQGARVAASAPWGGLPLAAYHRGHVDVLPCDEARHPRLGRPASQLAGPGEAVDYVEASAGASQPAERARCPGARLWSSSPLNLGRPGRDRGAMFLTRRAMFLTKRRCSSANGAMFRANGACSAANGAMFLGNRSWGSLRIGPVAPSSRQASVPGPESSGRPSGRPHSLCHGQDNSISSAQSAVCTVLDADGRRIPLHFVGVRASPLQAALASPIRGETASPERRGSATPHRFDRIGLLLHAIEFMGWRGKKVAIACSSDPVDLGR